MLRPELEPIHTGRVTWSPVPLDRGDLVGLDRHDIWIAVAKVSVVAQPHEHCLAFLGDDVYHLTALLQRIFTALLLAMIFLSFDLLFELKLHS